MFLSKDSINYWEKWIKLTKSRCHLNFRLEGGSIEKHVDFIMETSFKNIQRVPKDIGINFKPKKILEVGSSVGFSCFALAKLYPNSEIYSVEIDKEAVDIALSMAKDLKLNYKPIVGKGENLEFENNFFDLIICHQVIEHVENVEKVINEISRVLSNNGFIHFEAPNYRFPYEPHLNIYTIPEFGKLFVKFTAILQGNYKNIKYLNHLKFVKPSTLENYFLDSGLIFKNRSLEKIKSAFTEGNKNIKQYKNYAYILKLLKKINLEKLIFLLLKKMSFYPSILYTLNKK